MRCVACLQGDFHECRSEGNCDDSVSSELGHGEHENFHAPDGGGNRDSGRSDSSLPLSPDSSDEEEEEQFRTYKDDSVLKDQQSTGRKRAAKMYPLTPDAECEWKMKKNCGGGKFPIVGCLDGKQEARHHGPDKDTLDNDKGNVHRICHFCHNRWHTMNDPGYIWGSPQEPHNPLPATIVEIAVSEDFWSTKAISKAKD